MKKRLLILIAISGAPALSIQATRIDYSIAPGCMFVDRESDPKQLESYKEEQFDMTGTIVQSESGTCIESGVHCGVRSADQKQLAWLSASAADEATLKIAMDNGRLVHVTGVWRQIAECRFVKVTGVQPVEIKK